MSRPLGSVAGADPDQGNMPHDESIRPVPVARPPRCRRSDRTSILPTALPFRSTALPFRSTALPFRSTALPFRSTALPFLPTALPFLPTALPFLPTALPFRSTALPFLPTALPFLPTALPFLPTALLFLPTALLFFSTALPFSSTALPFCPTALPFSSTAVSPGRARVHRGHRATWPLLAARHILAMPASFRRPCCLQVRADPRVMSCNGLFWFSPLACSGSEALLPGAAPSEEVCHLAPDAIGGPRHFCVLTKEG